MLKSLLVLLAGIIETWLYAWYLLAINKKKEIVSSLVLIVQMFVYLVVIVSILKNANTLYMIGLYCLGCGIGNYLKIKHDKRALK